MVESIQRFLASHRPVSRVSVFFDRTIGALDNGGLSTFLLAGAVAAGAGAAVAIAAVFWTTAPIAIAAGLIIIAIGTAYLVTRREPARNLFLGSILALPIAANLVPPRRLELSVFDVAMFVLAAITIWQQIWARPPRIPAPLLPSRSIQVAFGLMIPIVAFSRFPALSAFAIVTFLANYVFFVHAYREAGRADGMRRLVEFWCVATIVLALGSIFQYATGIAPRLLAANPNAIEGHGLAAFFRISGFFPEAQTASQFFGATFAFAVTLLVRRRFDEHRLRLLLLAAASLAVVGMLLAVSRSGLLASVGVAVAIILLFNTWRGPTRGVVYVTGLALVAAFMLIPDEQLLGLLPSNLASRLAVIDQSFDVRDKIWFDTWDMFADHPATGIGPGSFRPYLMETRPTINNYYGIGAGYIPDQPENGYLQILYEGGVVGCVAFAIVVFDLLRRAIGIAFARSAKEADRTDVIAAFAALMVYGISFVTLYSFRVPQLCALVLLSLAVIWRRTARPPRIEAEVHDSRLESADGAARVRQDHRALRS